jgi:general secretion pathway protein E/type IV pilus assembly protein PilB
MSFLMDRKKDTKKPVEPLDDLEDGAVMLVMDDDETEAADSVSETALEVLPVDPRGGKGLKTASGGGRVSGGQGAHQGDGESGSREVVVKKDAQGNGPNRGRIGERLVAQGLITEGQLNVALQEKKTSGKMLGAVLVVQVPCRKRRFWRIRSQEHDCRW